VVGVKIKIGVTETEKKSRGYLFYTQSERRYPERFSTRPAVMLIYSSDWDVTCNTQGSDAALSRMEWSCTRDPALSTIVTTKTRNAWTEAGRGCGCTRLPRRVHEMYENLNLVTVYR